MIIAPKAGKLVVITIDKKEEGRNVAAVIHANSIKNVFLLPYMYWTECLLIYWESWHSGPTPDEHPLAGGKISSIRIAVGKSPNYALRVTRAGALEYVRIDMTKVTVARTENRLAPIFLSHEPCPPGWSNPPPTYVPPQVAANVQANPPAVVTPVPTQINPKLDVHWMDDSVNYQRVG
jgi:hypothetical protein